jgi:hypothetical protein
VETDYLIIGAGAIGMAFADELVTQSNTVRVVLVDRRTKPGGHWHDAYPFVRLHQPASYYGVNSIKLGAGGLATASRTEILDHFDQAMEKLCATGRVKFYAQHTYEGDGRFRSLVEPKQVYQAVVHRRTVDATYSNVQVPATHAPNYEIATGVCHVPINGLANLDKAWSRYVVIGAGKTAMEAVLFLLAQDVDPNQITWVISHDCWLINRDLTHPSLAARAMPQQLQLFSRASDIDDLYARLEAEHWYFRLDENIRPTRFRCATVTLAELEALRNIPHKVRMGRVRRIDPTQIVLTEGVLPTQPDVLHIDCTASGLPRRLSRPIFAEDRITLQPVYVCQPVFSAAFIAMVESKDRDDRTKNALCRPVPHPDMPSHILPCIILSLQNTWVWLRPFSWWLKRSRLSLVSHFTFAEFLYAMLTGVFRIKRAIRNLEHIQENQDVPRG